MQSSEKHPTFAGQHTTVLSRQLLFFSKGLQLRNDNRFLYHFSVDQLAERLLKTIRRQNSIRAGDRVAAAVSGGADSVALLCVLLNLRSELGIVLSVAHVNHKLRAEESDEDARFVRSLAQQHGLEIHLCEAPSSEIVSHAGSGIEAAARELRYRFFRQLARDGRVSKIATAHTLDDQAETVLLRLFRGTGIRGLSGVHPRIVLEDDGRTFGEIIRPLLGVRRAALLEYLRDRAQSWREDSSNQDIVFLRNRVRHRLLPIITEEFGEAAIEHMSDLAEIARAEEEHWERGHTEIQDQISGNTERPQGASLQVGSLLALPLATQRRVLRAWLEMNAPNLGISFRITEAALDLANGLVGRKIEIKDGWNLRRGQHELLLEVAPIVDGEGADYQYALQLPGVVTIPELGVCIEASLVDVSSVPEQERGQLLDPKRIPRQVLIRNWRPGDRYWPAHTLAAKKVKELLSDRHASGAKKRLWPVAAGEEAGLIWMRGFAVPAALCLRDGNAQAIWIREIIGMM